MRAHLDAREVFVQDLFAGADPAYRLPVRFVTPNAWHALFVRNMFIRAVPAELAQFRPGFTVLHAPDFQADPETDAVVLIGELGGTMEEEVADEIAAQRFTKPIVAFIGGRHAPPGKRMGHAGAIVSGGRGSALDKIAALQKAGALVAEKPRLVGECLRKALGRMYDRN